MPTKIDSFAPFRAMLGIKRALKTISRADGFNTTPNVEMGATLLDKVPDSNFPQIAIEMENMTPALQKFGGVSTGTLRYEWPAFVWGYVKTSQGSEALYRAGLALLDDVLAAVYGEETLQDGAGQGSVIMIEPGDIHFDMESFHAVNKGYFVAEFRLVFDVQRGANP